MMQSGYGLEPAFQVTIWTKELGNSPFLTTGNLQWYVRPKKKKKKEKTEKRKVTLKTGSDVRKGGLQPKKMMSVKWMTRLGERKKAA